MDAANSKQILLCILCTVLGFIGGLYKGSTLVNRAPASVPSPKWRQLVITGNPQSEVMPAKVIVGVLKRLSTANRHARSGIAILEIQKGFHMLNDLLKVFGSHLNVTVLQANGQTKMPYSPGNVSDRDVCPEVFKGMLHGYPFYEHGHEIENCTYGKKLEDILTILVDFTENPGNAERVVKLIHSQHRDVKVIAMTPTQWSIPGVHSVIRTSNPSGEDFNRAITSIKTKYILVAKGLYHFDENARIERLIRMVNYIGVDAAAGSHRNLSGHWKIDCFQMKMINYGFRVVEGYDLSYNSCVYCEYVASPFLARTDLLRSHKFANSTLKGELLLLNYFYSLKQRGKVVMNCPDSMFYTNHLSGLSLLPRSDWLRFAKHHLLNTIKLPSCTIKIDCKELGYTCSNTPPKGASHMPCCLKVLPDMLKYLETNVLKHHIDMEVESGTLVGAVKFYGTLPWELDADLTYKYVSDGQARLRRLIPQFKRDGYGLSEDENTTNCLSVNDSRYANCGYFAYRKHPFRIQLFGDVSIANDSYAKVGLNGTKVLIDGNWISSKPNPARYARNRYGDDIFEHVEHWIVLGYSSGWKKYNTGSWIRCGVTGKHYCLENFLPVGNIQFQEIWM